jgi:putative exosortase-associated protein (TIGR04073 family)
MKTLLTLLVLCGMSAAALADIQDPPMNDYGPTRKLGRALANIGYGVTELCQNPCEIQNREGDSAGMSYGLVKGFGRFVFRFGMGVYEIVTFPFPTYKSSYRPPYKLNTPWIHGGYEEFPPELGWNSKFDYVRDYGNGY